MRQLAERAKAAARALAAVPTERKDAALAAVAKALRSSSERIVAANRLDVGEAQAAGSARAPVRPAAIG